MLPTITVDDEKCGGAYLCRKCVTICPTHVLGLGTSVGVQKYRETDPQYFVVRGVYLNKCTGCMDCVNVCPNNAIQVTFDQGRAA